MLAITVGAFDEMAITTILPLIVQDLDGQALYGAAFSAFVLASLFGTVWAGTRCDLTGPRAPFILGLVIFSFGLVLATVATNMWIFVFARALQGLGNGIILALVFAVINLAYNEQERPVALALLSAAWVLPSLIAPTGAGAIAEWLHWRWMFPCLIPILLLAAALTLPVLKPYDIVKPKAGKQGSLGAAFQLSAGIAIMLAALSQQTLGILLTVLGIGGGLLLAYHPFTRFMPRGIWQIKPGLATAMALRFCLNFVFFGSEVFLPFMLIEHYGFSAIQAGTVLTSAALAWATGSWLQARFAQKLAAETFLLSGGLLLLIAISGITSLLWSTLPINWVYLFWSLAGLAIGISFNCVSGYTMAHTQPGHEGASASAAGISGSLGIGLATGFAGAIFNHSEHAGLSLSFAMLTVWATTLFICIIFLLLTWFRVRNKPIGYEAMNHSP